MVIRQLIFVCLQFNWKSVSCSGTAIIGVYVFDTLIVGDSLRSLNSIGLGYATPDAIAE
jgi:hypothetical protein